MTSPVNAPADSSAGEMLLDSITNLQSRGQVDPSGENASVTGVAQPSFKIELTTKDGKSRALSVGNKSATGGNLYVQVGGASKADLVGAELYDQLEKPAGDLRDKRLVNVHSNDIYQLKITSPKGSVELNKGGANWTIAGPTTMPADAREVQNVLGLLSNLRASEFVREDSGTSEDQKQYGLDVPVVTISFSANPPVAIPPAAQPTTAPTTQPAVVGSVKLGRFDDVMKQNVYAASSLSPAVAKVQASTLETFQKSALDLRDKKVLAIDPQKVTGFSIAIEKPATTQPTTRPAVNSIVRVARHHEEPPATTQPTTGPATTQATTAPTEPPKVVQKWDLTGDPKGPADDMAVDELLSSLNPLNAQKFVEAPSPTTRPADRYVLSISTGGASAQPIEVTITDAGPDHEPLATYDGLTFEVNRILLDKLEARFGKPAAPAQ